MLTRVPGGGQLVRAAGKRTFRLELRLLHDVLESSPMAGRYWVWAGLLLGWAREGDVLGHDVHDADFAFLKSDFPRMCESVPLLEAAGFHLHEIFRNDEGELTEFTFEKGGIAFDFLKMLLVGDKLRYYGYFDQMIIGEVPNQEREPFEFIGRRWLKMKDHALDLSALYGDWRTPRLDWRTERDSPAIVWRGPQPEPPRDQRDLSERVQPWRMSQS